MQDLSKVIKDRIKNYDNIIRETETGYVIEVTELHVYTDLMRVWPVSLSSLTAELCLWR